MQTKISEGAISIDGIEIKESASQALHCPNQWIKQSHLINLFINKLLK
jgi:hypothetical protein